jgi:hypothetical protein
VQYAAPFRLAVARRSPCLVVCRRGVLMEAKLHFRASDLRLVSIRGLGGLGS